ESKERQIETQDNDSKRLALVTAWNPGSLENPSEHPPRMHASDTTKRKSSIVVNGRRSHLRRIAPQQQWDGSASSNNVNQARRSALI
ncbi:MAG: hypothetical protein NZU63_05200, partial [Gemmataceae bacterium]|nr:hypothetical protein [Gemmataceae bacterium]